jgi:hypothetical protein
MTPYNGAAAFGSRAAEVKSNQHPMDTVSDEEDRRD